MRACGEEPLHLLASLRRSPKRVGEWAAPSRVGEGAAKENELLLFIAIHTHVKGGAGEGGSGPYTLNSEGRCRNESAVVRACTRRAERAIDDSATRKPDRRETRALEE